ncbi:hypothetical protein [Nocardia sp. bgisy134]|uniref:hypothetical protein n=1 Tax=Nocardia sp. bgisy134 TaxID=3413789 RepID=UPI003D762493
MAPPPVSGRTARAWWCENLPAFTEIAEQAGWRGALDAAVADIAAGTAVAEAIRDRGLPVDPAEAVTPRPAPGDRHGIDPSDLDRFGVPAVPVRGGYGCPTRACDRRATADPRTGHRPRCAIGDTDMVRRLPGLRGGRS